MVILSWYPANYFKISFGPSDQLRKLIYELSEQSGLIKPDSPKQLIRQEIRRLFNENTEVKKSITNLTNFVPFRLLQPFFSADLKGEKDSSKNKKTLLLAKERFQDLKPLYQFNDNTDGIILHDSWRNYFLINFKIIEGFCLWHLARFLQKKNPNTPNVNEKIISKPQRNSLNDARKIWQDVIRENDLFCPFSEIKLGKDFHIDHYLPWSFVLHDQIWNLIPINSRINSVKSNKIPDIQEHFTNYSEIQYTLLGYLLTNKKKKYLEDYVTNFHLNHQQLSALSEEGFSTKLHENITPLAQLALNAGFEKLIL